MLKRIASTFITKILSGIINLVIAVLISNWIGAEGKGVQGLYLTTLTLSITALSILGLMPLTYLYPRKPSLNYYVIVYVWSVFSSLALYVFLKLVPLVNDDYVFYIVITSFISSLVSNNLSIFIIKEKIVFYNLALFSQPLSHIAFIFGFYWIKGTFSVEYYIYALLFSYLVLFCFSLNGLFQLIKEKLTTDYSLIIKDFLNMLRYGLLHQTATIIQLISFRGAYFILDYYSSTSDVGVYSNAISITESIWIISKSLSLVFYSRMINTKKALHKSVFENFIFASFWLQGLAFIGLAIIPSDFYTYLFGNEFGELKSLIIILLPSSLIFGQSIIIEFYFASIGKHHVNLITSSIGMFIIIALSILLTPVLSALWNGHCHQYWVYLHSADTELPY
jgi:O-antigen/teichoic acid export membrane protein